MDDEDRGWTNGEEDGMATSARNETEEPEGMELGDNIRFREVVEEELFCGDGEDSFSRFLAMYDRERNKRHRITSRLAQPKVTPHAALVVDENRSMKSFQGCKRDQDEGDTHEKILLVEPLSIVDRNDSIEHDMQARKRETTKTRERKTLRDLLESCSVDEEKLDDLSSHSLPVSLLSQSLMKPRVRVMPPWNRSMRKTVQPRTNQTASDEFLSKKYQSGRNRSREVDRLQRAKRSGGWRKKVRGLKIVKFDEDKEAEIRREPIRSSSLERVTQSRKSTEELIRSLHREQDKAKEWIRSVNNQYEKHEQKSQYRRSTENCHDILERLLFQRG